MPCRFSADEAKNVAAQWNNNNPGNKVIVVSAQVPLEQALFDQRSAAAIVEENLFRNGTVFADLKK
jgi:hypothetical protein